MTSFETRVGHMIAKSLLAFLILLVQETATFTSLLFATHRGAYPSILIHILFLIATWVDIFIGYFVGGFFKKKFLNSKIAKWVDTMAKSFSLHENKYKRWVALFLLGNFSFPWINATIAGYLQFPFWESALFNFLGDVVWYVTIWLIVIGVGAIFKNIYFGLIVAILFALAIMLLLKFLKSIKWKRK